MENKDQDRQDSNGTGCFSITTHLYSYLAQTYENCKGNKLSVSVAFSLCGAVNVGKIAILLAEVVHSRAEIELAGARIQFFFQDELKFPRPPCHTETKNPKTYTVQNNMDHADE